MKTTTLRCPHCNLFVSPTPVLLEPAQVDDGDGRYVHMEMVGYAQCKRCGSYVQVPL